MGLKESQYDKLLDELDDGHHQYSFFRKYIESSHPDPRVLVQMKCIEKLRWELSEERGSEISWTDISNIWVEEGYAKAFADVYNSDDPCICRIYDNTLRKTRSCQVKNT